MRARLAIAIAACAHLPVLLGQPVDNLSGTTARYVQQRQASKGFVLSPDEAAEKLRGSKKPIVLDLRPAEESRKLRLKGAQHRAFSELFTTDALNQYQKANSILVVDDGSSEAVEGMVLLRLFGYRVFAVSGGLNPLAQSIKKLDGVAPVPGGSVKDTLEGTDLGTDGALPPPRSDQPRGNPEVAKSFWQTVPAWLLAVAAGLIVVSVGLALWFLVLQPRRRAKGLLKATELLRGGGDSSLKDAESLLVEAISSGLKPAYLREARFLLAYVRARLGQSSEALLVLKDSVPARDSSPEALYLDLWLKVKEKRWEEAERRWHEHGDVLRSFLHSKELAGIMYLEMGRQHLARRAYDLALSCFQKVRGLGVFQEQVPEHLTDLELVLALNALFDDTSTGLAKERFEAARHAAEAAGKSTLLAQIGLLLCRWKDEDFPDIDEELAAALESLKQVASKEGEQSESAKLLPRVALWYAVSLMYHWLIHLPKHGALPVSSHDDLINRLDFVRSKMPEKGDADLVGGLVEYYCAKDNGARRRGVDLLRKAIALDVTLPEILYLVQCEDRLVALEKGRFDSYLKLLKAYLSDGSAPLELRKELYEHLSKFERFRQLAEITIESDQTLAPSLHDVAASCELVEDRVQRIFSGHANVQQRSEVEALLGGLRKSREDLSKTVNELGKTEQKLMWVAGETLLPEESEANEVASGVGN